ncbi:VOC family protein [Chelatococcus reniformis]|uniref:Glyoxalase n=1 Tax=Chelatococcus reniformis TaxID=1494448 RepID=A0A916XBY6_9HYPH|nr:VOC family protein [Chelatococcus reniformis]GGC62685.1 glyoxalase [Chelatococcus reniformis]
MTVPARVNLITLGVDGLDRSAAFYERLGWRRSASAGDGAVAFFALDNLVLALFSRASLADDMGLDEPRAGRGDVSLAINVESPARVDEVLAAAIGAGARLLKAGQAVFWGGYSGYFVDPEGHAWEVAHNPFFPLNPQGEIVLPP